MVPVFQQKLKMKKNSTKNSFSSWKLSKKGQNGEKSSKNFPICEPKPSKSEWKRDKIVQKFHIFSWQNIKKVGSKNAKIP